MQKILDDDESDDENDEKEKKRQIRKVKCKEKFMRNLSPVLEKVHHITNTKMTMRINKYPQKKSENYKIDV